MKKVLVLDFGGQYNLLVARRVRECGVYCEIKPYTMSMDDIRAFGPAAIIFTGGPATVFEPRSTTPFSSWVCPFSASATASS